ncbi:LysM peptidoglycan-binding domain-containing protein [Dellaglioa sp. BT-FLS60]
MNNTVKSLLLGTIGTAGLLLASNANANAATVKVQTNDTVWTFAQKYGVSIKTIETLNNIDSGSHIIIPGQSLNIPAKDSNAKTSTDTSSASDTTSSASKTSITVKTGDSLWSIAKANGISITALRSANGFADSSALILPGQKLAVTGSKTVTATAPKATPAKTVKPETAKATESAVSTDGKTVTVKSGDSLWSIAQTNGVTISALCDANGLTSSSMINPGQTLKLTGSVAKVATTTPKAAPANNTATTSSNTTSNSTTTAASEPASTSTNTASNTTTQTASYSASKVISIAKAYIGTPYVWGGSTPSGFDCSGFTQYVFAKVGINLNRNTIGQESNVTKKSVSAAQPGDLLFWGAQGSSYHVGIYLGGGQYIAAPEPGQNVKIGALAYYPASFAGTVNN